MNKIILSGNLGRDPELRVSTGATQTTICRFPIAVNDGYGENRQTTWVNITAFGKQAENCDRFLSKGKKVLVEGRLQIRKYQKQDGTEGTATEVIANYVEFLGDGERREPEQPQWTAPHGFQQIAEQEHIPF